MALSLVWQTAPRLRAQAAVGGSAPPAAPASGAPAYGRFGIDVAGMDRTANPGNDFYSYANGSWHKAIEIPADRSNWGTFAILADLTEQRTRGLIEDAAKQQAPRGSTAQKVGDYYAAFMDEAAIEKQGLGPIRPILDYIAGISTRADLSRAVGLANRYGIGVPIRIDVDVDLKANDRYSVYLMQGGLGLPDRDYYLDDRNARF